MKTKIFWPAIALLLVVASAQIEIDLPAGVSNIPFSLQSLVIFIMAAFLKPKQFLVVISIYILLGVFGLPVFAGGASGFQHILGNSGGFIYGFILSGLFISYYFDQNSTPGIIGILNVIIQATMVLFFFGIVHLSIKHGLSVALNYGLYPFWKMALLKALLATAIIFSIKHYIRRASGE